MTERLTYPIVELVDVPVRITAVDAAEGVANDCLECPGALAIRRAYPCANRIEVGDYYVLISNKGVSYNASAPRQLTEFIRKFDAEGRLGVELPVTFTLRLPDPRHFLGKP